MATRGRPKKDPKDVADGRLELRLKKATLKKYTEAATAAGLKRTEWALAALDAALSGSPKPAKPRKLSPEEEIRRAYMEIATRAVNWRVRLVDLRRESSLDTESLNTELLRLFEAETITLYAENDGLRRTPEVKAAAYVMSGVPQHIIFWSPPTRKRTGPA